MPLQADQINDLITTTLRDLGRLKWTDIMSNLQEHIALPRILDKKKVGFSGGYGIQWNVQRQTSGNARMTGLYRSNDINVGDTMTTANAPWRHVTSGYVFDKNEFLMNSSSETRIVDLVKTRRADALVSLAELMEVQFWGKPGSADDENMWGVGVYIVYDNSATAGTFALNTGLPTGFTTVAGINPATVTRWANGSGKYSTIDTTGADTNLITLWRKAIRKSGFKSLPAAGVPQYAAGSPRYEFFVNEATINKLEYVLMQQNDNLGKDGAPMDNQATFHRMPVIYAPYLDLCNQNPVFGLDWNSFQPVFLEGNYMAETTIGIGQNALQPLVSSTSIDTTVNIRCTDRRKNFVLSDSASAMSFSALTS